MTFSFKKSTFLVATLVTSFALSGCVTDPYTGQRKPSKSAIGAVAGAVVGAATSGRSDRGKGALIGATVGGGAGYYMDRQEKVLRQRLEQSGVGVTREGQNIVLNMPGNITFDVNRAEIKSSFFSTLNGVVDAAKEFKETRLLITGHTDSDGSDQTNMDLSRRRAESVGDYLASMGISAQRIEAQGQGERYPISDNTSEAGKQANRRVEIEIVPIN
ncbi:MAG: OmpA family protein [Pseudomonadota bacterium]